MMAFLTSSNLKNKTGEIKNINTGIKTIEEKQCLNIRRYFFCTKPLKTTVIIIRTQRIAPGYLTVIKAAVISDMYTTFVILGFSI
jgi:hypothetical protein